MVFISAVTQKVQVIAENATDQQTDALDDRSTRLPHARNALQ